MNELIQLYKIFQIIQVKILVACKFQIEQELSYSNYFLNSDQELATHRIQVIDQPQTFTLLIFYFTSNSMCKLQVTARIKYRIKEVLAREHTKALMIFKSDLYLLALQKFYKISHFNNIIRESLETQYFLAQSSCSQSTVASVPKPCLQFSLNMNFQLEAQIIQKQYQLNYQYYSVLYEIISINFIFFHLLFFQGYILNPLQELFTRGQVQRACQSIQRFKFILTFRFSFGATYVQFMYCQKLLLYVLLNINITLVKLFTLIQVSVQCPQIFWNSPQKLIFQCYLEVNKKLYELQVVQMQISVFPYF
ncbi:Hypothetical_protein [Hexamita inflata]|uniref:Hypothetical_protein n=1 Tax=Hexamita inflata TaxID=28002 RepID=A0AA86USE7_9EUKA|nr:Hypothetical protein HINF_LOCUS50536 [Hexamita inflata]